MIESINTLTTNNGLTTVCTIHQPPVDVFLSFDRLLLLEKGEVVYSGPPAKCADFFASEGFVAPPAANPAGPWWGLVPPQFRSLNIKGLNHPPLFLPDYFFKVLSEEAELAAGLLAAEEDVDLEDQAAEGIAGFPARWRAYSTLHGITDDAKGRGRPENEVWPALNMAASYERSQCYAACGTSFPGLYWLRA